MDHRPTEIDYARLAAYIDGEGCIKLMTRYPAQSGHYLRIYVTNTDPRLIVWLKQTFGGKLQKEDRRGQGHKIIYRWFVTGREAEAILTACMPYFIFKKDQAELGLAYQSTIGRPGKRVELPIKQERDRIATQLTNLKRDHMPELDIYSVPELAAHITTH